MRFKPYLIFIFLAGIFLLSACNLGATAPAPQALPASPLPILPTDTALPAPTNTPLRLMTATATQPTPTSTPTVTLTLFYDPTVTATPSWMQCPLIITVTDTRIGDMLHVRRCTDGLEDDLGPFAKGVYAAGPNNMFIVYVSGDGMIYAAKLGDEYLTLIANLEKDHFFTVINKKLPSKFSISFIGAAPYYRLVLYENVFEQKNIYDLPTRIQE